MSFNRFYAYIKTHNSFALVAYILLLISPLFFFLPSAPQTPDGAEILSTAMFGGVPHPPGFPIQQWINRIFLFISPLSPVVSIELLSLLYSVISLFLLFQTLKLLNVQTIFRYLILPIYLYYPPIFGQAIQIEKYSFFLLLMNMVMFFSFRCLLNNNIYHNFILLSFSTAIAFSFHYTSIILLPYYFFVLIYIIKTKNLSFHSSVIVKSITIIFVIPIAFYLSLPLLQTSTIWPDWGRMKGFKEVFEFFFAFNHGDHRLLGGVEDLRRSLGIGEKDTFNPLKILFYNTLNYFHITIPLFFLGALSFFRQQRYIFLSHLYSFLFAVILFSVFNPRVSPFSLGYMERHTTILQTYLIIFFAIGVKNLAGIHQRFTKPILVFVLPLVFLVNNISNFDEFLGYKNSIVNIYRNIVGRYIPKTAIYVDESDFLSFSGVKSISNEIRYPIVNGFSYGWYLNRTAPELDSRIIPSLQKVTMKIEWTFSDLIQQLYDDGHLIVTTSPALFEDINAVVGQKGLVWGIGKGVKEKFTLDTIRAGLDLCDLLKDQQYSVTFKRHYFISSMFSKFKFAFLAMASYLHENQYKRSSKEVLALVKVLKMGEDPSKWHSQCDVIKHSIDQLNIIKLR